MRSPSPAPSSPLPSYLAVATALGVALGLGATPRLAHAEGPFAQGRCRVGLGASSNVYGGARYVVAGAGFGCNVADGLELSADAEQWFGAPPTITRISPAVRYTFAALGSWPPYVGLFYRHWFIGGGEPDVDTAGVRGGIIALGDRSFMFGLGAVYEVVVSTCSGQCSALYPEIILGFAF